MALIAMVRDIDTIFNDPNEYSSQNKNWRPDAGACTASFCSSWASPMYIAIVNLILWLLNFQLPP